MIYEYKCLKCEHEWEIEAKVSDPVQTTCPSCKKETAKRQISKSTFQLLGDRWAKDGY